MDIPPVLKNDLIKEFEFILKSINDEPDIKRKLYYFSALRGALERVTKYYYNRELLITQLIADISYQVLNDRIIHLQTGDTNVPLSGDVFEKLKVAISELKQAIENNQTTYPALETMFEVAYTASGPGFYTRSFLDYVYKQKHNQEGSKAGLPSEKPIS